MRTRSAALSAGIQASGLSQAEFVRLLTLAHPDLAPHKEAILAQATFLHAFQRASHRSSYGKLLGEHVHVYSILAVYGAIVELLDDAGNYLDPITHEGLSSVRKIIESQVPRVWS